MADQDTVATMPVVASHVQAELQEAFVRIDAVPAGSTLIDLIDSDLWLNGVEGSVEAGGSDHDPDELDGADVENRQIA